MNRELEEQITLVESTFPNRLRRFIYHSFQHRYNQSETSADDTPAGDSPSFRYVPTSGEWKDWAYEDRFYGGEPFAGNIQIFSEGKCVWYMDIQGEALPNTIKMTAEIHKCLGEALCAAPPSFPFRGPSAFIASNSLRYANIGNGTINRCWGQESIKDEYDNWLYGANWRGGMIGR